MSHTILKTLKFSNLFSYGINNAIDLDKNRITQLTAVNGCLAGNSVIIAADGSAHTIAEVVENKLAISVLGVTEDNKSCIAKITNWFTHKPKMVYKVQLDNGNLLFITDNHLLKTPEGWKPLKELSNNNWLEDSRTRYYESSNDTHTDDWWELITYLITEGGLSDYKHKITFTNQDQLVLNKFISKVKSIDSRLEVAQVGSRADQLSLLFSKDSQLKKKFITEVVVPEIQGYAVEKCFPASVFSVSDTTLDKIFAIYLETDRSVEKRNSISFSTSSIKLGHQLLHLLRYRYNLQCSSRIKKTTHSDNMEIIISRLDYCKIFVSRIIPYVVGYKKEKLEKLLTANSAYTSYTQDLVPTKYIKGLRSNAVTNNDYVSVVSKKAYQSFKNTKHGITRKNYKLLLDCGYVTNLSNIDSTRYIRIKSITPTYEQVVYDIETTTGNFIAGDTLVHNSGKSSLALVVQELLYSKNVKGIKKGDLLNRWSKTKNWDGTITFTTNNINYEVSVVRSGASTKVKLLENDIDISEHKVLDTYKKIQEILGLDFEVFTQLTYQSSTDLLDFLKATDTNRKKFLINLFNLERYIETGEQIKAKASTLEKELLKTQGELKSIEDFLNSVSIPDALVEILVPEVDTTATVKIAEIQREIENINETCKKIDKNNMLISEQQSLQFDLTIKMPDKPTCIDSYQVLDKEIIVLENDLKKLKHELNGLKIADKCSTCGQPIDNSHLIKLRADLETKISDIVSSLSVAKTQHEAWAGELLRHEASVKNYKNNKQKIERFEQLSQLIDASMPTMYPDYNLLSIEQKQLIEIVSAQTKKQNDAIIHNKRVSAHNAKIEALKEQKNEFLIRQTSLKADILDKSSQITHLNILKKAFSPSGIVAFKLENLTKELETAINYYLSILSDGQFQVEFSLDKEKLNINVINNGDSAPIETVSGGEFSRIQTSVLLAIRTILAKLGGSSINLLFLDEITGVLDEEGKEKLIEVLQKENDLNVFLISHDFTHPLIDKISIIKKNNVSAIQT